jgi:transposase
VASLGTRAAFAPWCPRTSSRLLLGERPSFVTVSDRYTGYNHLPIEQRQVCWAHLLRDFERIAGRAGLGGRVGRRLLGYGCLVFRWRAAEKPAQHFAWLQKRIRIQLELGSAQTQCSRTANTCANLIKMWPAL